MSDERKTIYLNPTTREVMAWYDAGLCSWCGGKCGSGSCRLRFCDSCTAYWIADTEADYDEFDAGGQATVAPHKEDCDPCRIWWTNLHLENPPVGQFNHRIRSGDEPLVSRDLVDGMERIEAAIDRL